MKAVSYDAHGGVDVLQLVDLPDPEPGPLDVVVEVGACALNRLDIVQRNGWYTLPGYSLPHVAGMDVAGTVIDIGSDVGDVAIGARVVVDPSLAGVADGSKLAGMGDLHGELGVIGGTVAGGYAERCLAPASHVYALPDDMAIEHAAGSGVSVAAIQLAVDAGATVLATAGSAEKLERAAALGATHVLNNRTGDVAAWAREVTGGRGVDVVFDHVGTALFAPSVFALAIGGRLVCCGNTSGDEAVIPSLGFLFHSGAKILGSDPYPPEEFGPTWERFCAGSFVQTVDREFALADAAGAQQRLEAGDVFGKIVLRP